VRVVVDVSTLAGTILGDNQEVLDQFYILINSTFQIVVSTGTVAVAGIGAISTMNVGANKPLALSTHRALECPRDFWRNCGASSLYKILSCCLRTREYW
jgi:hypothetical protein